MCKLLTEEQILTKYKGKFINLLAHHMNGIVNNPTLFEIISVKSKICENHNEPQEEINLSK